MTIDLTNADKFAPLRPLIEQFVFLTRERRKAERASRELGDEIARLAGGKTDEGQVVGELMAAMQELGENRVEWDGMTIYVNRDVGLSLGDKEVEVVDETTGKSETRVAKVADREAVDALLREGLADYVRTVPDISGLRKLWKEELDERTKLGEVLTFADVIPRELRAIFSVYENPTLRGRDKTKKGESE